MGCPTPNGIHHQSSPSSAPTPISSDIYHSLSFHFSLEISDLATTCSVCGCYLTTSPAQAERGQRLVSQRNVREKGFQFNNATNRGTGSYYLPFPFINSDNLVDPKSVVQPHIHWLVYCLKPSSFFSMSFPGYPELFSNP